jgi:hypothetical protein
MMLLATRALMMSFLGAQRFPVLPWAKIVVQMQTCHSAKASDEPEFLIEDQKGDSCCSERLAGSSRNQR